VTTDAELDHAHDAALAAREYHDEQQRAGVIDVDSREDNPAPEIVEAPAEQGESSAGRALEAVTRHVIENPGIAGRDEFLSLAAQARMLHLSGAAPKAIRDDPYVAFHVAMAGRDLGLSPTAAMQLIDVIETSRGPQLSLSPQLRLAQVRKKGLGDIRPRLRTAERCVAVVLGPDGEELGETVFTWEDAQMAGLAMPDCQPGEHTAKCRNYQSRGYEKCNQGYVTYPQRMHWWRAVGYGCDDYFPEASLGLYSPEELGAVVDVEGRPVDPSTVALPPGYTDTTAEQRAVAEERQAAREAPADAETLWGLQELVLALPEDVQKQFRDAWTNPGCKLRGTPVRAVPGSLLRMAKNMVNAHWARAVAAGTDKDAAVGTLRMTLAAAAYNALWLALTGQAGPLSDQPPGAASEPAAEAEAAQADGEPESAIWLPALIELSAHTQQLVAEVTHRDKLGADIAAGIAAEVEKMHWQHVNTAIVEAGQAENYPPGSPIDLRRMAVTALRLETFLQTGELPT